MMENLASSHLHCSIMIFTYFLCDSYNKDIFPFPHHSISLFCNIPFAWGVKFQNLMRKPKANNMVLQPLILEMLYGVCWN